MFHCTVVYPYMHKHLVHNNYYCNEIEANNTMRLHDYIHMLYCNCFATLKVITIATYLDAS